MTADGREEEERKREGCYDIGLCREHGAEVPDIDISASYRAVFLTGWTMCSELCSCMLPQHRSKDSEGGMIERGVYQMRMRAMTIVDADGCSRIETATRYFVCGDADCEDVEGSGACRSRPDLIKI